MPDDTPTTERSITASIAVFLFAIARHWREVRTSGGTRIPNHLFASSRAAGFLLDDGPPEHLRQEWNIPPGAVNLGPTKDTIEDVIAYLGLSDADIQFLERYYRLTGGCGPSRSSATAENSWRSASALRASPSICATLPNWLPPHRPMPATRTRKRSTNCFIWILALLSPSMRHTNSC